MIELNELDILWLLICSCLLLLMQAGFTCLESGLIRTKNSINVVMKNLVDIGVTFLCFGAVGFAIMFSDVDTVLPSFTHILADDNPPKLYVFFIFKAMFCATAVTIVSGAVAERMTFAGYVALAILTTSVTYPIAGSWVWGSAISNNIELSWLANIGFVDFAGATMVHSVGGWIALAAIIFIGPRLGRYSDDGKNITNSSVTIASLGALLIWVGWLGFNGGSLLKFDERVALIILNTVLGGAAGLVAGLVQSAFVYKKALVMPMINGGLIGLISVTGAANLIGPIDAILLGTIAGFIPHYVNNFLNRMKLDDAIGAIPVHLAGGIFATLATGFFVALRPEESRWEAISVQALGILCIGVFVFVISYVGFALINKVVPLRVSAKSELMGLNASEHNQESANADMLTQLKDNLKSGEVIRKINIDPQSDAHEVAEHYNFVMSMFEELNWKNKKSLDKAVYLASHDILSGLKNKYAITKALEKEYQSMLRYGNEYCVAMIDVDHFKKINDNFGHEAGDDAIKHIAKILDVNTRATDILGRVGGEEFCIILPYTFLEEGIDLLEKLRTVVSETDFTYENNKIDIKISAGIARLRSDTAPSLSLKHADKALYRAKTLGRNQVVSFKDLENL